MAKILKEEKDAEFYAAQGERIKKAFNARYFHPETGIYGVGGQTQLSEALYLGLVEKNNKQQVLDNLLKAIAEKEGHVETGVLGTKFMVNALMQFNRDDILFELARKEDFPGWGYWIKNGATTMYQNWDATQSRNHIMFGTIGDYFYKGLAGINCVEQYPGFKHFLVKPLLDNAVTYTNASLDSPYGKIGVQWNKTNGLFKLSVDIPVNTSAEIILPSAVPSSIRIGKKLLQKSDEITQIEQKGSHTYVTVSSGRYEFSVSNPMYDHH
jgi:alpha-L-rhamnosidase